MLDKFCHARYNDKAFKNQYGRLAQLVAHPLDVREVTSSSLVSSTTKLHAFGVELFMSSRDPVRSFCKLKPRLKSTISAGAFVRALFYSHGSVRLAGLKWGHSPSADIENTRSEVRLSLRRDQHLERNAG